MEPLKLARIIAPLLTLVVFAFVGHAVGLSWPLSVAVAAGFAAVTAGAMLLAKRARPRDPRPWFVACGAVSLLLAVLAIARRDFGWPLPLEVAGVVISAAGALSVKARR